MKKSKILAMSGIIIGIIVVGLGFFMKNSWQVCAGTYMILWVYEVYKNHELMLKLKDILLSSVKLTKLENTKNV
jgi:uncharacterized protein (DUF983 family)